jgi:hypothetical protein
LTEARLANVDQKGDRSLDTDSLKRAKNGKRKRNGNFFINHRHGISGPFLVKILGSVSVAMILPCAILTATHPTIASSFGECDLFWGYSVIVLYMGVYSIFFMVDTLVYSFFTKNLLDLNRELNA